MVNLCIVQTFSMKKIYFIEINEFTKIFLSKLVSELAKIELRVKLATHTKFMVKFDEIESL